MSGTFRKSIPMTLMIALVLSIASGQGAHAEPGLSSETLKELAKVRRATARYHNIQNADADGYVDANFVAPEVGCHMINPGLIFDGAIDLEKPELLVYADCSLTARGKSELRAVEYSLFCGMPDCRNTDVPQGFSGDHDVWMIFPGDPDAKPLPIPPQWTLHAWVWRNNPDGIFKTRNPAVD